jgi:hypothetical protein
MARTIMFSQVYPAYHPKAGQPTFFVEKIWKRLEMLFPDDREIAGTLSPDLMLNAAEISPEDDIPKSHTIRAGSRWKKHEKFSPRIWSGAAYRSRQITIAGDLMIENIWSIIILPSTEIFIDGQPYGFYGSPEIERLAYNDGLRVSDFEAWFSRLPFEGQIICWDPHVEY